MQRFSQVLRQIEEKRARENPKSRKRRKGFAALGLRPKEEAQGEERERRRFG